MQPYSQGWKRMANKVQIMKQSNSAAKTKANAATRYAQKKGWMDIDWSKE